MSGTSLHVLITGASRGIGKTIAEALVESGHKVVGTSRTDQEGLPFPVLKLDIGSDESVARCVESATTRLGRIDVLINNAGFDLYGGLEDISWAEFTEQIDTNFLGLVRMTKAVLPRLRQQGGGRIVNISSLGGLIGLPMNSAYAASKFAVEGFSEALRLELLPQRIFISLIEPPAVSTDTLDQSIREAAEGRQLGARTRKMVDMMHSEGRASPISPKDVARVVLEAITSPNPRLRYPVGAQARWLPRVKALAPQAVFERMLMKRFP